jgi:chromosome segregation ATPase
MFGKIAVLEFILMLALGAFGVTYFKYTEKEMAALYEDKAKLETAVSTQQDTIAAQEKAAKEQAAQMITLQQSVADAENKRRDLEEKLRQKNIANMARSNTSDLESRINRATTKAFSDITAITTPQDRSSNTTTLQPQTQTSTFINSSLTPSVPKDSDTQISNSQPAPRPPKQYGGSSN